MCVVFMPTRSSPTHPPPAGEPQPMRVRGRQGCKVKGKRAEGYKAGMLMEDNPQHRRTIRDGANIPWLVQVCVCVCGDAHPARRALGGFREKNCNL